MSKRRILLVDDEESFTRLLKLNLEQTGKYDVRVVNWADDALPAAKEFKPDIALLDVMMPRRFGGDVAACLRAEPGLHSLPIVFLTAAVPKHRVEAHGGEISGFPFLSKPATLEQVVAIIEQQFS
jgi:CheY-like chemotaxis protein